MLPDVVTAEEVMGLEGAAARSYFDSWPQLRARRRSDRSTFRALIQRRAGGCAYNRGEAAEVNANGPT
jgi:hypothetical protein